MGIAVDNSGAADVTGLAASSDFPTKNPIQGLYGDELDAFVAKLSPEGNALVYCTRLGGSGWDAGTAIAVETAVPLMSPVRPHQATSQPLTPCRVQMEVALWPS